MSNVKTVDRMLLFLNLVLLLFVVMVPFGTGTLADYLAHGGFDARLAVAVYCLVLVGMSAGFSAMFEWSLREGRTHASVPRDQWWAARRRFTSGGLVYLLATGVAFISAPVAFAITGAVALYYVFERTPGSRARAGSQRPDSG